MEVWAHRPEVQEGANAVTVYLIRSYICSYIWSYIGVTSGVTSMIHSDTRIHPLL